MQNRKSKDNHKPWDKIFQAMQDDNISLEQLYELSKQCLEEAKKDLEKAQRDREMIEDSCLRIEEKLKEKQRKVELWYKEFVKHRWYESRWDFYYRMLVNNVPKGYLDLLAAVYMQYGVERLLSLIEYSRKQEIKNLANNAISEYSQKETISANDIYFSVRCGKKYKRWSFKRICMDEKHFEGIGMKRNYNYTKYIGPGIWN